MITRKIPKEARPVVRILRREVRAPDSLPKPRWPHGKLRWFYNQEAYCPMGLHKDSKFPQPSDLGFAGNRCDIYAVAAFANWWDEQKDAKAAIEAVWGRR